MALNRGEVPIFEKERVLGELHTALGYKRLNRTWAKGEILIGLLTAGIGLLLLTGTNEPRLWPAAGLVLFVLGGYMAMAGHRSHLYQSVNVLTAYLAELIRSINDKGKRE